MRCNGPRQAAHGTPKRRHGPLPPDSQSSTAQKKVRVTGSKQIQPRRVLGRVNVIRAVQADGKQPERRSELVLHGGKYRIR